MPYQTTEISINVAWVFFKGFCGILGFLDPFSSVIEGVSHVLRDLSYINSSSWMSLQPTNL